MAFSKSQVRNKRGKNVTPEEHRLVVKMALACLRELTKAEYELPAFNGTVTIQTKCRGQRSYGGWSGISIDISLFRLGGVFLNEYKSYQQCKVIGSAKCDTPEIRLLGVVAHEIAHHVQYRYLPSSRLKGVYRRPHGGGFRAVYGYLRRALINDFVEHTGVLTCNAEHLNAQAVA